MNTMALYKDDSGVNQLNTESCSRLRSAEGLNDRPLGRRLEPLGGGAWSRGEIGRFNHSTLLSLFAASAVKAFVRPPALLRNPQGEEVCATVS